MSNEITQVLAIGEDAIRAYDATMKSIAADTPEHERFKPESKATPLRDSWLKALENNASQPVVVEEESK